MYRDKTNNLEKLARILELINQLQRYNISNTQKTNSAFSDAFNMASYYKSRIAKNELIIDRLKNYYNNTLNKLTTFKRV